MREYGLPLKTQYQKEHPEPRSIVRNIENRGTNEKKLQKKKLENSIYPETQRLKRLLKSKAIKMRKEIQKDIQSTERHIINNIDTNPKIFYHHINNKKNSGSSYFQSLIR